LKKNLGLKQLRDVYNAGQKRKAIKGLWEKWLSGIDFKLNVIIN